MNNIFNKNQIAYSMYMIIKDGKRTFEKDKRYFISCKIPIILDAYTLCGTGNSGFVSYAVLNKWGVMIQGDMITEKTVIDTSSDDSRYLMLCGYLKDLDVLMALDSDVVPDDPPYIDYPSSGGSGSGGSGGGEIVYKESAGAVLLASGFDYKESEKCFYINGFSTSSVTKYDDLPDNFMVYVSTSTDFIDIDSSISVYGNKFAIRLIDGNTVSKKIESLPKALPILFDKKNMTARMLYSFDAMPSGSFGLEDMFFEIEN